MKLIPKSQPLTSFPKNCKNVASLGKYFSEFDKLYEL